MDGVSFILVATLHLFTIPDGRVEVPIKEAFQNQQECFDTLSSRVEAARRISKKALTVQALYLCERKQP